MKEEECRRQKVEMRREIEQAYRDKEASSRLLGDRVQSFETRMAILERERDEEIQKYQNKIVSTRANKITGFFHRNNRLSDIELSKECCRRC